MIPLSLFFEKCIFKKFWKEDYCKFHFELHLAILFLNSELASYISKNLFTFGKSANFWKNKSANFLKNKSANFWKNKSANFWKNKSGYMQFVFLPEIDYFEIKLFCKKYMRIYAAGKRRKNFASSTFFKYFFLQII